ncbi:uncharacterized protein F4812DRAFT_454858 [Daldinia caldariorum]|uniref:uncharacterized protein n=1 Tax=Daldinia caldariorum TaxID=326644 RepID=UPI0020088446|nr:uncharacterized protein F4812DRAFT_454858 [Daldinia caldariorum]KAI1473039.1 hypothetical protein F4812DRAFT_454858 [Daldinia caldariorum]
MATPQTSGNVDRPIFTKQAFLDLEVELERAGPHIQYTGRNGSRFKKVNPLPGQGFVEAPPNSMVIRNFIEFKGERTLKFAKSKGWDQWFTPVIVSTRPIHGPNITASTAMTHMKNEIRDWESNEICRSLSNTLKAILPSTINKIIAFGLGAIGNLDLSSPFRIYDIQSYREHAYVLTIARALNEIKGANEDEVAIYLQDPTYTTVCREVLTGTFGFNIINGYGARGFAMVDENTLMLGHHPNFPLREIIADIARPAAMCVPFFDKESFDKLPTRNKVILADIPSARVHAMLQEYEEESIPGSYPKSSLPDLAEWRHEWMEEPFHDTKEEPEMNNDPRPSKATLCLD